MIASEILSFSFCSKLITLISFQVQKRAGREKSRTTTTESIGKSEKEGSIPLPLFFGIRYILPWFCVLAPSSVTSTTPSNSGVVTYKLTGSNGVACILIQTDALVEFHYKDAYGGNEVRIFQSRFIIQYI